MEARRREPERREERIEPVEREEYRPSIYPTHPGLVDWSSVWAGTISAFATLAILAVLVIAVGWATGGGTASIVWGIIVTLIAFLVGGYVAGSTSAYSGRVAGFVIGSMIWALGTAFALVVMVLGASGLFVLFLGGTAPAGLNVTSLAVGILVALIVAYIGSVVGTMVGLASRPREEVR